MKIDEKDRLKIANTCYALVLGRFADMLNPAMRGPNFSWEGFPDMAAKACAVEIFLYFDSHEWSHKKHEHFKIAAFEDGLQIAQHLIERSIEHLPKA